MTFGITPKLVLDEISEGVSEAIDSQSLSRFEERLENLMELHAFILKCLTIDPEEGPLDSYANLEENWFYKIYEGFNHTYLRVFERAVNQIEQDDKFFKKCLYIPSSLIYRTKKDVPPFIVAGFISLYEMSFYSLRRKFISLAIEQNNVPPSFKKPVSLEGVKGRNLNEMFLKFLNRWSDIKKITFYKIPDNLDQISEEEVWDNFQEVSIFLRRHLEVSGVFLNALVIAGDVNQTKLFANEFLKWTEHISHKLPDGSFMWPILPITVMDLDLNEAKKYSLSLSYPNTSDINLGFIFSSSLENYFKDNLLLVIGVLVKWLWGQKNQNEFIVDLIKQLNGQPQDGFIFESNMPSARLFRSWKDIFVSIIRICTVGSRLTESGYIDNLDKTVARLDRLTENERVEEVYSPTYAHHVSDLRGHLLVFLMSQIPDGERPQPVDQLPNLTLENVKASMERDGASELIKETPKELASFLDHFRFLSFEEASPVLERIMRKKITKKEYKTRCEFVQGLLQESINFLSPSE